MTLTCPDCGCTRLYGPAIIVDSHGVEHRYYDCARCHCMVLELADGTLAARGQVAW